MLLKFNFIMLKINIIDINETAKKKYLLSNKRKDNLKKIPPPVYSDK